MSGDWRELLSRALEGGPLAEDEARALAKALADAATRREAAEWLGFDAALRARLAPPGVGVSRERLLASTALREKSLEARQRGRRRRFLGAAVAAAAVVAAAVTAWLVLRPRYPEPLATGSYTVVGGQAEMGRGAEVVAGAGGARLALGGYCEVALDPGARVVVRGEPRAEAVALRRGRAVARVEPDRGEFTVLTPLGRLEVVGTEFEATVERRPLGEGGATMSGTQRTVAMVIVVSGAVAFRFGDAVGVLGPGARRVFAGEAEETLGVPEALRGFKGMMIGTVTAKGGEEFVLRVEKITRTWKANKAENPRAAVGQKAVCELWPKGRLYERHKETLAGLKVGDRVLVGPFHLEADHDHLTVVEALRKLEEKPEEPDQPNEGTPGVPEALRGFKGMLTGTIVKKGSDEFIVQVEKIDRTWKANRAEHPERAAGQQAVCELWPKGRLYQQHKRTLAGLKAGDRVRCEPFHLEAGHDHLTVVEELRKLD
ncbi:MAG: FecR domain-containing protein [Planctomycetota bacterium]